MEKSALKKINKHHNLFLKYLKKYARVFLGAPKFGLLYVFCIKFKN
jgi:hypothetical protein